MRIERDIAVATRDGTPIVVDVFRPDGDEPVPVIAGISPYGKDLHWPERFPLYELVEQGEHMVWETPNPDWWVPRGYALVRADTRGTGKSPGVLDLFGPKDAEDFYDVIEWSAAQPWSTGKVAASGISWFAMMAWRVAALQPPHLAAVIAWEGLTDFYREAARQGGLYPRGFIELWWGLQVEPQRNGAAGADWREELPQHPLLDAYHEARSTDLSRVDGPAAVRRQLGCAAPASAGQHRGLARRGLRAQVARGPHGHARRPVLLRLGQGSAAAVPRPLPQGTRTTGWTALRRSGWRSARGARRRGATRTPGRCRRRPWRELHLGDGTLSWEAPEAGVDARSPRASRRRPATRPLELTGPVALRLWVTAETDDLDVFARLQHVGADGEAIPAIGPQGGPMPMALGWLRASHRELDAERSLP